MGMDFEKAREILAQGHHPEIDLRPNCNQAKGFIEGAKKALSLPEVEELYQALSKFGNHPNDCAGWKSHRHVGFFQYGDPKKCNCNYGKALSNFQKLKESLEGK